MKWPCLGGVPRYKKKVLFNNFLITKNPLFLFAGSAVSFVFFT